MKTVCSQKAKCRLNAGKAGTFCHLVFALLAIVAPATFCFAAVEISSVDAGKDGKKGTTSGYSPFVDKTYWPDGQGGYVDPVGEDASNYDFKIAKACRTPAATDWTKFSYSKNDLSLSKGFWDGSFKGNSMTFANGIWLKTTTEKAVLTFPNLTLASGAYFNVMDNGTSYLDGALSVQRPRSSPVEVFQQQADAIRGLWIRSVISGSRDSGFYVYFNTTEANQGVAQLTFSADNSSAWYGNVKVGYFGRFAVCSAKAIGAPQAEFDEKAVHLLNGGAFECQKAGEILPSSDGRGVYVEATGGELCANVDWVLQYPISGEGMVTKTGSGTLTLQEGAFSAAGLNVAEGTVRLSESCGMGKDTPVVLNGGRIVCDKGDDYLTNVSISNGGVAFAYGDEAIALSGFSAQKVVPIYLSNLPELQKNSEFKIKVLTLPTSVRTLHAGDFSVQCECSSWRVSVECDSTTGLQSVFVHVNDVVLNQGTTGWYFNDGTTWDSGNPVEEGFHYRATSGHGQGKIASSGTFGDYSFAGASLAIENAYFMDKAYIFRCDDLRMFGGATLRFGGADPGKCPSGHAKDVLDLDGGLYVSSSPDNPVMIAGSADVTCRILSTISGNGKMQLQGISDADKFSYELVQDNSEYRGTIEVRGFTAKNATQKDTIVTLKISDESNLGSNPNEYYFDALWLGTNQVLSAKQTLTIDDENRGLYLGSGAKIEVPDGVRLSTLTALNIEGGDAVSKIGSGIWAIGQPTTHEIYRGQGAALVVEEGFIELLSQDVLKDVPITFKSGTGFVSNGMVMPRVNQVVVESAMLDVCVSMNDPGTDSFSVPVLAMTSEQAANDFAAKCQLVTKYPHRRGNIAVRKIAIDDVECFGIYADYARRGLILVVR